MPDPKFLKPWHGVPRERIHWNPAVIEEACIGCGTCVTGCNRLVYRFDFERKKAVVVDPLNCMVGCTTCANTCPTHAIANREAYVAGPPAMIGSVIAELRAAGIRAENIHVDSFGGA
jgi:NAD-dependent dihydropyrimidine dehydrogenase PreA subunit